jgi:hypothetical protein
MKQNGWYAKSENHWVLLREGKRVGSLIRVVPKSYFSCSDTSPYWFAMPLRGRPVRCGTLRNAARFVAGVPTTFTIGLHAAATHQERVGVTTVETIMLKSPVKYIGAQITDVRRGRGVRSCYVYAKLRAADGEVLISADLPYIEHVLSERLTPTEMIPFKRQIAEIWAKGVI